MKSKTVRLGGERVKIRAMNPEDALRFLLLLLPYVPIIADARLEMLKDLPTKMVSVTLMAVREALVQCPEDLVAAASLLIGKPPDWIREHCSGAEFFRLLSVLDELNDFRGLAYAARVLGLYDGNA